MRKASFAVVCFPSQRCEEPRGAGTFPQQGRHGHLLCGAEASSGERSRLRKLGEWGACHGCASQTGRTWCGLSGGRGWQVQLWAEPGQPSPGVRGRLGPPAAEARREGQGRWAWEAGGQEATLTLGRLSQGDYENVTPEVLEDEGIHYSELIHFGVGERPVTPEGVDYVTLKH